MFFSPYNDSKDTQSNNSQIETTVKKTFMVNKFYSEGDFLYKEAQPISPNPNSTYQGDLRVTPIRKAERFEYPMQKILYEIHVPQNTQNLIYENNDEEVDGFNKIQPREDIISKSSESSPQHKYNIINDFKNVRLPSNTIEVTPSNYNNRRLNEKDAGYMDIMVPLHRRNTSETNSLLNV